VEDKKQMSIKNKTSNLELSQFIESDPPKWLTDYNDDMDKIDTAVSEKLSISDLLNKVYPVGAIYESTSSTSPANLFGGSWTQLTSDAYLKIVTSNAGSVGGTSSAHKIAITSMPSHNHGLTRYSNTGTGGILDDGRTIQRGYGGGTSGVTDWTDIYTVDSVGGGNAYYPYYYGIYVWRRTM
jgi:hypothetical protein